MIVAVVVAILAAGLAPSIRYFLRYGPPQPGSSIQTPSERWLPPQGGELHALIENIFFAIGAFLLIRFTASRVKDKPIQFKIRSLFLMTTIMSCVFAIGRLYRGSVGQIAMTLGGFVALQFVVFAIASLALRQLDARNEGTFWRTYLGMLEPVTKPPLLLGNAETYRLGMRGNRVLKLALVLPTVCNNRR